jgi:hypothetical protein
MKGIPRHLWKTHPQPAESLSVCDPDTNSLSLHRTRRAHCRARTRSLPARHRASGLRYLGRGASTGTRLVLADARTGRRRSHRAGFGRQSVRAPPDDGAQPRSGHSCLTATERGHHDAGKSCTHRQRSPRPGRGRSVRCQPCKERPEAAGDSSDRTHAVAPGPGWTERRLRWAVTRARTPRYDQLHDAANVRNVVGPEPGDRGQPPARTAGQSSVEETRRAGMAAEACVADSIVEHHLVGDIRESDKVGGTR